MANADLTGKRYFQLDDEQRLNWLRLIRSQNVGPATFRDLISHYGSASSALEAIPELARRGGAAARIRVCSREDAEREMVRCEKLGAQLIAMGEQEYPALLRAVDQCPPLICLLGNPAILAQKSIAIVGSRNASIAGLKLTQRFAHQLGDAGYVTISGLARGIDTAAHKASMEFGTAAVFAGGVDRVFPDENIRLAKEIVESGGALISEMPIGWQPRAQDFPRRNRIVTGLAQGVVVVEAARRSGSLISARLANEMGRTVFAVPGSPLDPRSHGTNSLIKQGATLVENADDVLESLLPLNPGSSDFVYDIGENDSDLFQEQGQTNTHETDDGVRTKIISALSPSPSDIDDIIRFTGAGAGQVQLVLLELSLAGRLERHAGGRVSLIE